MVKNLPAMWDTWVQSLGRDDPLEKGMSPHSSSFCLENSMDRGAWWATVHGGHKESDVKEQLTHTLCTSKYAKWIDLMSRLLNTYNTHTHTNTHTPLNPHKKIIWK